MPGNTRFDLDAYKPAQIAERVEKAGVAKANLPALQTVTLATLAGAFIAFGAMFFTVVITGSGLGFGPTRLLGGMAFSLGLVLVVIAGAELFTGNNLLVMACVDGQITLKQLLRNWSLVFLGNLIGSIACAILVVASGTLDLGNGAVATTASAIASAKVSLPWHQAVVRGILCNALVCLAVWMTFAARDVTGKIVAILFPISAFVALGFEHSVANMYFLPVGMMLEGSTVTLASAISNLVPVTIGNVIGGGVLVGIVYRVCYPRQHEPAA